MQHDSDLHGILRQGRSFEDVEHNTNIMEQGHEQTSLNPATTLGMSFRPMPQPHLPNCDGKILPPLSKNTRQQWLHIMCYNCENHGLTMEITWVLFSKSVVLPKRLFTRTPVWTVIAFTTGALSKTARSPKVIVKVNGTPIQLTLDTGATTSIVGSSYLKRDCLHDTSENLCIWCKLPIANTWQISCDFETQSL